MPPFTRRARANWAISHVFALPEMWAIVAEHSGVVGAWRLTGVCRASREGAKVWLRTLPGLVVCGGRTGEDEITSEVWRLDLGQLRWELMPRLTRARYQPACCAVRGGVVVLGGLVDAEDEDDESETEEEEWYEEGTSSVEIFGFDGTESQESESEHLTFRELPPLASTPICGSVAIAVEESESEKGEVLLIGGWNGHGATSAVHKVDLATGVCTPQPPLLSPHGQLAGCSAARLPDSRIVCVGEILGGGLDGAAQVLEPPQQGTSASEASWQWTYLPAMSGEHFGGRGCVLSDGRFAVFGGWDNNNMATRSCEALTLDGDGERWVPLPPIMAARMGFACAAIGGCVIVAGGEGSVTAEVYEEALGRWRRLPCNLPYEVELFCTGSALM
jgi:hypothetical protein